MSLLDPEHVVTTTESACCSSCGLRHTRRPDWLCPRCGMPVGEDIAAPTVRAPAPVVEEGFPAGSRIAGAIMVATAVVPAIAFAKQPSLAGGWPFLAAILVLAALGLAALLTVPLARWLSAALAVLYGAAVAEAVVRERLPGLARDPLPAAVREALRALVPGAPAQRLVVAAFLAGCLVLVVARPGRVRIAIGVLLALPLAALELVRALTR